MAKSIQEQLPLIYELLAKGITNSAIAKQVGCNERTIGNINNGETYYDPERDYPVRKKESSIKCGTDGDDEEERLWGLAYELIAAQWYHEQKTLGAIMAMRRIPFEESPFPFTKEELEGRRPSCNTMQERLKYLEERVKTCQRLLSNTLNL